MAPRNSGIYGGGIFFKNGRCSFVNIFYTVYEDRYLVCRVWNNGRHLLVPIYVYRLNRPPRCGLCVWDSSRYLVWNTKHLEHGRYS